MYIYVDIIPWCMHPCVPQHQLQSPVQRARAQLCSEAGQMHVEGDSKPIQARQSTNTCLTPPREPLHTIAEREAEIQPPSASAQHQHLSSGKWRSSRAHGLETYWSFEDVEQLLQGSFPQLPGLGVQAARQMSAQHLWDVPSILGCSCAQGFWSPQRPCTHSNSTQHTTLSGPCPAAFGAAAFRSAPAPRPSLGAQEQAEEAGQAPPTSHWLHPVHALRGSLKHSFICTLS